jgi:hypothetical protein
MRYFLIIIFLTAVTSSYSQHTDSIIEKLQAIPEKYYTAVDNKISSIDDKLTKQTEKYLLKLQKQENKLARELAKIDSGAAGLLTMGSTQYEALSKNIKDKTSLLTKAAGGNYDSYIDTLSTSLSFLKQFKDVSNKVNSPLADLKQLQDKFQQAEKVKEFIAQRKEQLKQLLSKYTTLPAGLQKQYTQLSKTAYYYSAQVKAYKELLKDPKKAEEKALALLQKLPAFQKFMKENSQLASLFGIPGTSSNTGTQALAGLQTRASVQALIQNQVSMGGPNAQAQIQQNLAQAHGEINKLKDKINKLGGGSGNIDIPDFTPNEQKTKSFFKRLEFGSNIQFAKAINLLPSTADIGLSIGYKLNEKSIVGIGGSYKMGMGSIQHINITHQGVGLRSFVEYKIKKSFFMIGGYEMNYRTQFQNIDQLKNLNAWQQSGLIGVTKKYKVSKKLKGSMQLLWDFMSYDHFPVSQPVVFRLGYTIK